jgi:hypothetical protein
MNPYEAACERFERANRNARVIEAYARMLIDKANREWEEAQANLRQHESQPGIPLPQYREQATA